MVSTVEDTGVIFISAGFLRIVPASLAMSGGIVAEKNKVCFFGGVFCYDFFHIIYKSHIQHSVSFVQNQYF